MKNAMKKIMGLLLVAVLLVSVVPFQASAITLQNQRVVFNYVDTNGKNVYTYPGKDLLTNTFTDADIENSAKMFMPAEYEFVSVDATSPFVSGDSVTYTVSVKKIIEEMYAIVIELVIKDGSTLQYNVGEVKKDQAATTMTKADALVKLNGKANDYEITTTQATARTDTSKVVYSFSAEKKDAPTNPDNSQSLTANFYVNNALQTTRTFTTNGSVRYLLEQAGYTVSNYSAITANVAGANKGLDDMISLGQTVNIYMTQNSGTTNPNPQYVTAAYYVNNAYQKTNTYSSNSTVRTLMENAGYKVSDYSSINATVNNATKGLDDTITVGQAVTINMYTSNSGNSGSGSTTNKFPYKVYLHVYLNNNIGEPDRNINITNTLATDGVVSMSEVKNLIPDYYKAKNSNGIGYDGLYLAKGNWVKDYVTDANKYEKLNDVDVRTGEEYVHINVMITNATAKTSSTADTSNPKTGDAIFMTITVMGLSAAALTGLFFYDKKRKAL